jgi:hypothetical protein
MYFDYRKKTISALGYYPAKLSFKSEGEKKIIHDNQKLKYMITKPPLQIFLEVKCEPHWRGNTLWELQPEFW